MILKITFEKEAPFFSFFISFYLLDTLIPIDKYPMFKVQFLSLSYLIYFSSHFGHKFTGIFLFSKIVNPFSLMAFLY